MISREDILRSQDKWALAIIGVGEAKEDYSKSKKLTSEFLNDLYDFREGKVQFKPTKASKHQFRNDKASAISYFIGGNKSFVEDYGFAMKPWKKIEFFNDTINIYEDIGIAMGNYFFTDYSGNKIRVEYSFVYLKKDNSVKIILHHSSLPYKSV